MEVTAEILLVDDHALVLEGMQRMLESIPNVRVANAVTSGKKAAELIRARDYDIYVLDVDLPDLSGFDLVAMIREINEDARIIISTMHEEIWIINRLIRQKVNAVILKSSEAVEFKNAVRSVLEGDTYTCPRFQSIRKKLCFSSAQIHSKDIPTKRELDVLKAVARGCNTHEIAEELNITENTVETFRKRLILKFGAKNAVDMVVKAVTKGWVDLK